MNTLRFSFGHWLTKEVQKHHAILLPVRLFIGLGWLRSSVEKLVDPEWSSGAALHQFFAERIADGDVAFPFYQLLMEGIFSTHAPLLSKIIMAGEFYCGIAIIIGLFIRPALLAGLFMNLNFILAGSVNPSAFYIVIQLTLLPSAVGHIFGLDSLRLQMNRFAKIDQRKRWRIERAKMISCFVGCLLFGLMALVIASQIQTADPVHSVEDPAMLLLILLGLQSLLMLILGGQAMSRLQELQPADAKSLNQKERLPVRQNPIPEYVDVRPYADWVPTVRFKQS